MKKDLTLNDYLEKERNREEIIGSSAKLVDVLDGANKVNDIDLSNSALKEIEDRNRKLISIIEDPYFNNLRVAIERTNFDTPIFLSTTKTLDTSSLTTATKAFDTSALTTAAKALDISAFTTAAKAFDTSALTTAAKAFDTSVFTTLTKAFDTSALTTAAKAFDTSVFTTAAKALDASSFASVIKNIDISCLSPATKSYVSSVTSLSPISKIYLSELQRIERKTDNLNRQDIIKSPIFAEAKSIQDELIKIEPRIGVLPITTLEKAIESNDPEAFEKAKQEIISIERAEQVQVSVSNIPLLEINPFQNRPIDILIITGLPIELRIFCEVLQVKNRWFSEKYTAEYYFASVRADNKEFSIALTFGEDMGNFYSSQITNAAIEDLNPKAVISAGIGYTLNPNKLQLCDLHITNSIVYWGMTSKEYGKAGRKERAIYTRVKSNHLFDEVRKYKDGLRGGKTPFVEWKKKLAKCVQPKVSEDKVRKVLEEINCVIKCGVPTHIFNEQPNVELGKTMVSDDVVIASIDEIKKRSIFDSGNENHLSGEMEAAGVAMSLANRKSSIEFLAIRGISDFGFGKEELEDYSNEFRIIAATRAATFIKSFLESNPTLQ